MYLHFWKSIISIVLHRRLGTSWIPTWQFFVGKIYWQFVKLVDLVGRCSLPFGGTRTAKRLKCVSDVARPPAGSSREPPGCAALRRPIEWLVNRVTVHGVTERRAISLSQSRLPMLAPPTNGSPFRLRRIRLSNVSRRPCPPRHVSRLTVATEAGFTWLWLGRIRSILFSLLVSLWPDDHFASRATNGELNRILPAVPTLA